MPYTKCKDCGKMIDLAECLRKGATPDTEYNDLLVEGLIEQKESDIAFDCRCECGWYFRIHLGVKFTGYGVFDENSDDMEVE